MNREVVSKYSAAFDQIIASLGLQDKPECIWNSDEKGFQYEHSPVSVGARVSIRRRTSVVTFLRHVGAMTPRHQKRTSHNAGPNGF